MTEGVAKRHSEDCGCCECSVPPTTCELTGIVSDHDVTLQWSWVGAKVNKVIIYKQSNYSVPERYDPTWEVMWEDDGTSEDRELFIENGECMRYKLFVCNKCGCCEDTWTDGRGGECDCQTCSFESGTFPSVVTVTRRYRGKVNLQCGCARGVVSSLAISMSGHEPLYTSDVDRYVYNPANDNQFCYCECTRGGFLGPGIAARHNAHFRRREWQKLEGADCINGTYIFNTFESRWTHPTFGEQCSINVSPSYYKLGQVVYTWKVGYTWICGQTNPELLTYDWLPSSCRLQDANSTGPFSTTYDIYLIGAENLRQPVGGDPIGGVYEDILLDGSTTGPESWLTQLSNYPYIVAKQVSTTHPSTYYTSRNGKEHLHMPCGQFFPLGLNVNNCNNSTKVPYLRHHPYDPCGWKLDGWKRRDSTVGVIALGTVCHTDIHDFIAVPNVEMIEVTNGPTYPGELMSYTNMEVLLTTEYAP